MTEQQEAAETQTALRRKPSQRRSQDRVERILGAAEALIEAQGSDSMRMSEVAARAGISIGSLYQYFPDKSAIIRTLAERANAECRICIEEGLAGATDIEDLCEAFADLFDEYYRIFLAEPVMRDIWSGLQADKTLREFALSESRANGEILARALSRLKPQADPAMLAASAFLIMELGETTMRLAVSVERAEGDALVEAYKRIMVADLRNL